MLMAKKVSVDNTTWDTCGLAFSNLTYRSSLLSGSKNIEESIEMTPEEAGAAKGNLSLIFVGNMSEPYWSEFSDYAKPTINDPTEMAWDGDALVMKLVQIWIFNRQTGKFTRRSPSKDERLIVVIATAARPERAFLHQDAGLSDV